MSTTLTAAPDLAPIYDRIAPNYDVLHRRWLRFAGGEAQSALEAAARAYAMPGAALLDAGAGTGAFARRLVREGLDPDQITLLDPSAAMLSHSADLPCERALGRLEALPFADQSFDLITCAWALETVADQGAALNELWRVLRPGGLLCLAFCAETEATSVAGWLISQSLKLRGTGRFLSISDITEALRKNDEAAVVAVPLNGPAAVVLAHKRSV